MSGHDTNDNDVLFQVNDIIQLIVRSEKIPLGVWVNVRQTMRLESPSKKVVKEKVKKVVEATGTGWPARTPTLHWGLGW